ncbi:4-aminobutyrate aminotransferase [Methanofollis sp. W23]|uniref:acetyl ornithine aminotransferase family protein n=1 Tax=Methanofollis sp. W23 TaxID=2817849 RepID=UPI001DE22E74|nr:acetyl ornithine aminotransferase family protein [Methanofollis sp. W23]MBP2145373.1 4-aminobutyrate aminotransferase [Methanofollis sp. W23]
MLIIIYLGEIFTMEPLITTRPPGPRARAVLERDRRVVSQSMAREYPLVIDRAEGTNLWDVDGNRYLDFTAGIAVMNVGWNHPAVVEAVREQAGRLSHGAFLDFCSEVPVRFAEELVKMLPAGLDQVYFSNSGAESVEAALKLARRHTKRKYFISFYGGFHGRTYGALSLTATKVIQRKHFGPFLPVVHAPYPDPYRPFGLESVSCAVDVIRYLREEVFRTEVSPEEVAAIVVEPVQGEGGYVVPPVGFLQALRELCDEYGILLVADEVQAGCYRTGRFLASEHEGVVPDIVCLAKALGGGMPLGATLASEEVMDWPPGSHASTFGGNNVACAAGLAVLEIMQAPGFGAHVREAGAVLLDGLLRLQGRHEIIGDVRGVGLMAGIELVEDRVSRVPARATRNRALVRAFERGLTLLPAGESVIRFSPPLVMDEEEIRAGLMVLDEAMEGL